MRCGGGTGAGLEVCLHTINGGLISQERLLTKGCCRPAAPDLFSFRSRETKLVLFWMHASSVFLEFVERFLSLCTSAVPRWNPRPSTQRNKSYKPVISSATFSSDDALKILSWKTWVWVTYESGSGFEVIHLTIRPFQWHCHDLILYFFCLLLPVFVFVWGGLQRARLNDITDQFSINLRMWWDTERKWLHALYTLRPILQLELRLQILNELIGKATQIPWVFFVFVHRRPSFCRWYTEKALQRLQAFLHCWQAAVSAADPAHYVLSRWQLPSFCLCR